MVKYLTRKEELVLLAICRMSEDAYLVNIREYLNTYTGKKWTVGNVWVPLDRMVKMGYLDSFVGPPTAKRGGKSIKYYRLARKGYQALIEIKKMNQVMWDGIDQLISEEK